MRIEYACYDYSLIEEEVKDNIEQAIKMGITNIALYQYSIPSIKSLLANTEKQISISCPIDYPYGLSDFKSRNFMVTQAAKLDVSVIDLVIPAKCVTNRKYDKIRDDIKSNLEICQENNIELRYILEYRVFNHEILAKICQILKTMGVNSVIPSTGQMIDDINDNIIAAKYLNTKSGISTIINGNVWNKTQAENIKHSGVESIRLHKLSSIDFFIKNNKS